MGRNYKTRAKRLLMQKINNKIDSKADLMVQLEYLIKGWDPDWYVNQIGWVTSKKQSKLGVFKRIHPRVK